MIEKILAFMLDKPIQLLATIATLIGGWAAVKQLRAERRKKKKIQKYKKTNPVGAT